MSTIKELMAFLDNSLTSYHAINQMREEFAAEDFLQLSESRIWEIETGKSYFVIRNDSSMIAFRIPACDKSEIKGFHIYAAHSDSPAFKIKENPEMNQAEVYVGINTEKYGGMILSTWMDRPLTIAGRVCVENNGKICSYLVTLKDNICMIPNLAIHMNRDMNNGVALNPQKDMIPLLMMEEEGEDSKTIKAMLAEELSRQTGQKYDAQDILAADLFVENSEKAVLAGAKEEFIMSARYDDLACVYAGMKAMIETESDAYINVLAVFDNEEVGSLTRQGADSSFLRDTLDNIADGLGISSTLISKYFEKKAFHDGCHLICEHDETWICFYSNKHSFSNYSHIAKQELVMKNNGKNDYYAYKDLKKDLAGQTFSVLSIDAPFGYGGGIRQDEILLNSFLVF